MSPGELIKEKLSIADLVSSYLKLERAGKNFKARCPFHPEKTASFFISPDRGTYHCFGCHRGGDIFSFVQEIEGYDFRTALTVLAERAGVTLPTENIKERSERERLLALLEEVTLLYQRTLLSTEEAKEYVKSRGITEATVRAFRIGYAPESWHYAQEHLKRKGYTEEEMERAGVVIPREPGARVALGRGYYDRFRDRIMFPVMSNSGQVVGFSGRALPREGADVGAKYINTPETALYHKSLALYGYSQAKQAMRTRNVCVLVEGQMDVVLSHQAGVPETVAVSGTALSKEHLVAIKRLSDTVIMAFDADEAGLRAGERAILMALEAGLDVSVAPLPSGKDPADLVREKPSLWHSALQSATHVIDFSVTVLSRTEDVRERGKKVRTQILPLLARLESEIDRAHFITKIAQNLGIAEDALWRELHKIPGTVEPAVLVREGVTQTAKGLALRRLIGIVQAFGSIPDTPVDALALKKEVTELLGDDVFTSLSDEAMREAALEAEELYGGSEQIESDVQTLLRSLKETHLKETFATAMEDLKKAEVVGDEVAAQAALKRCQQIAAQLSAYK